MFDKDAEIVRVSQSEYDQMKEVAAAVRRKNVGGENLAVTFMDYNNYPTVEEMEAHAVVENLRDYLPFLVYYLTQDVFASDWEELQRSKSYIEDAIANYVDIVEDEDLSKILSMTPSFWKKASHKQRCDAFGPLVAYYGRNEFETFIKDLGWKTFMGAYGYTKKNAENGEECEPLREELAIVWDTLQS